MIPSRILSTPSLTGNLKGHYAVTPAGISIVLVANPGNDLPLKSELLILDLGGDTVDLKVVFAFLLTSFDNQLSLALDNCEIGEVFPAVPANPMKLKFMFPEELVAFARTNNLGLRQRAQALRVDR